jgi:hypothetical protein
MLSGLTLKDARYNLLQKPAAVESKMLSISKRSHTIQNVHRGNGQGSMDSNNAAVLRMSGSFVKQSRLAAALLPLLPAASSRRSVFLFVQFIFLVKNVHGP